MCVDYRAINKVTVRKPYTLPTSSAMLDTRRGFYLLSTYLQSSHQAREGLIQLNTAAGLMPDRIPVKCPANALWSA